MVSAISPPRLPPVRWQGRARARRRIVFTRPIRPIHLACRAARPCSPIAAPLSAERSRAPGRHGGGHASGLHRKRIGTMARTSKMARAGTVAMVAEAAADADVRSVGETEAVAAVETGAETVSVAANGETVLIPLNKLKK